MFPKRTTAAESESLFKVLVAQSIPEYTVLSFSVNGKEVKKRRISGFGKAVNECAQRFGGLLSVHIEGNSDLTRLIFSFADPTALLQGHLDKLAEEVDYSDELRRSFRDIVDGAKYAYPRTFCNQCYVLILDAKGCRFAECRGHGCRKELCDDCITHLRAKCEGCVYRDDRSRVFCDECAREQFFCHRWGDYICSGDAADHISSCTQCYLHGTFEQIEDAETDSDDDDFEEMN